MERYINIATNIKTVRCENGTFSFKIWLMWDGRFDTTVTYTGYGSLYETTSVIITTDASSASSMLYGRRIRAGTLISCATRKQMREIRSAARYMMYDAPSMRFNSCL